jgi:outer membrane PBP1 activator LpoA protein
VEKREAALRSMLTKCASNVRLLKAAERVRDARVQVLRAKIGEMPSVKLTPSQHRRIARLEGEIQVLNETAPQTILAEFRRIESNKLTAGFSKEVRYVQRKP